MLAGFLLSLPTWEGAALHRGPPGRGAGFARLAPRDALITEKTGPS
jgi:hypothetical protein